MPIDHCDQTSGVLVVDAANVVGSVPDGWWADRAGAARRLHDSLVHADLDGGLGYRQIVVVLEGAARAGVPAGVTGRVRVVHAAGSGDDEIVAQVRHHAGEHAVTVASSDRGLLARVPDAARLGPRALRAHLG